MCNLNTGHRASLSGTWLSQTPHYLELKSVPLGHNFQSLTIGYLEPLTSFGIIFSFPLGLRVQVGGGQL